MKKFIFLIFLFFITKNVCGATFFVNTVVDFGTPPAGSLRKAINDAVSGDIIYFSISNANIILISQLIIDKNITIDGQGNNITISGNNLSRIFDIDASLTVTLENLTLTNGGNLSGGEGGGAIRILGTTGGGNIILENIHIKNSVATDEGGGGVFVGNFGNVTMNNVTINDCSTNFAIGGGGIMINNIQSGTTILNNCTIFNNSSPLNGGGFYTNNGNTILNNCTITNNSATSFGGGIYKWTGGIGTLTINNTIILNNNGMSGKDYYGGTFTSTQGNNIYSDISTTPSGVLTGNQAILPAQIPQVLESPITLASDQSSALLYFTPPYIRLAPKTNNTDPTAIGKATNATTTDLRGIKRKGEWIGGSSDVGAWESMVVANNADAATPPNGSLRSAVNFANTNFGNDIVYFDIQNTAKTILLSSQISVNQGTTIDGYTQAGATPATLTNPADLKVGIKKAGTFSGGGSAFRLLGDNARLKGLCINDFNNSSQSAISVSLPTAASIAFIQGNYIGTDITGNTAIPNFYGIVLENNTGTIIIGDPINFVQPANRNIIAGNSEGGIYLNGCISCNSPTQIIRGNYIGTKADGLSTLANNVGISILGTISNGTIEISNNTISGNTNDGIQLGAIKTGGITIKNNNIGVGKNGIANIGNGTSGISLSSGIINMSIGTMVGEENIIAYNNIGINSLGNNNNFLMNNFFCNTSSIFGAGNNNRNSPVINIATTTTISGTCDGCTSVAIYEMDNSTCVPNNNPQGKIFITNVIASANLWTTTGTFVTGKKIVAIAQSNIAMPNNNNTSRFSAMKVVNTIPTTSNKTISGTEDITNVLTIADFNFNDSDAGDALEEITITNLNLNGASLLLNGNALLLNSVITKTQILAGNLRMTFVLNANALTGFVPTFDYKVSDGKDYSVNSSTLTIDVVPVNDIPSFTLSSTNINLTEDAPAYNQPIIASSSRGGGTDETSQTLTYTLTTTMIFLVPPTIVSGNLAFTLSPNFNGSGVIKIKVKDDGGTLNGGVDETTEQDILINVTAINDAPTFIPAVTTISLNEDAPAYTYTNFFTSISRGGGIDEITQIFMPLVVNNPNPSAFSVQPFIDNISGATADLKFTLAPDFNGTINIGIQIQDDGGTANGGLNTSNSQNIIINVTPINDASTLANIETTALTYTEGDGQINITNNITVADVDNTSLFSAKIRITTGFVGTEDELVLSPMPPGVATINYNVFPTYGELTISKDGSTGTLLEFQNALRAVKYQNTSASPSTATRTIEFQINDGQTLSTIESRLLNVTAVNNPPVLGIATTNPTFTTFTEGTAGGVNVALASLFDIIDVDNTTITGFTAMITNGFENGVDVLSIPSNPTFYSTTFSAGLLTVTFFTPQNYASVYNVMGLVKFNNQSQNPSTADRTIIFQVNDGQSTNNLSNTASRIVKVIVVNQNPTITTTFPNTPSTNEDTALNLTLTATDPDNTPAQLTWSVTQNPSNGIISFVTNTGGEFTFDYTPNLNFFGTDNFKIKVADNAGGESAELSINVIVNSINDAPEMDNVPVQSDINVNSLPKTINLTGINFGGGASEQTASLPNGIISILAISSNPNIVPNPTIVYNSPNATGTLTYNVASNVTMPTNVTITITISDNGSNVTPNSNTAIKTFIIPVISASNVPILTTTAVSNTQINLTWTSVAGATSYDIQRSLNQTFTGVVGLSANATATSFSDGGLLNNTQYYYRVRALNSAGNSAWSNISGAETSDVASSPSNLTGIADNFSQITLNWVDNSNNEITFIIERASVFSGGFFEEIAQTNANITTYQNSNLIPNTTYIYRVRATNDNGNSDYTNLAIINTPINTALPIPTKPIDLIANTISPNQIELTWAYNVSPNVVFEIERASPNATSTFMLLTQLVNDENSTSKTYNDTTGIQAGIQYCYRIKAKGGGGNSQFSNISCTIASCNLGTLIVRSDNPPSSNSNITIQVCAGKSASLLVNKNIYKGIYQWKRNGINIPNATFRNYFADESGAYTCEVSIPNSTCNGITINSAIVDINNSPQQIEVIERTGTLRASVNDAGAGNYQWYKDYQPIRDSTNYFIRTNTPGTYFVTMLDNGCVSISPLFIFGRLTALEPSLDISNVLKVSPNPAEKDINISIDANIYGECAIYIIDMQGRKHLLKKDEKNNHLFETSHNIQNFAKGLYILEVQCGKYTGRKKLIFN
jgi:hypothetical protein